MSALDGMIARLQLMNARGARGIATRGPLSDAVQKVANTGVLPGRLVYDPVSGQTVEVVGSATAYLAPDKMPEVKRGE